MELCSIGACFLGSLVLLVLTTLCEPLRGVGFQENACIAESDCPVGVEGCELVRCDCPSDGSYCGSETDDVVPSCILRSLDLTSCCDLVPNEFHTLELVHILHLEKYGGVISQDSQEEIVVARVWTLPNSSVEVDGPIVEHDYKWKQLRVNVLNMTNSTGDYTPTVVTITDSLEPLPEGVTTEPIMRLLDITETPVNGSYLLTQMSKLRNERVCRLELDCMDSLTLGCQSFQCVRTRETDSPHDNSSGITMPSGYYITEVGGNIARSIQVSTQVSSLHGKDNSVDEWELGTLGGWAPEASDNDMFMAFNDLTSEVCGVIIQGVAGSRSRTLESFKVSVDGRHLEDENGTEIVYNSGVLLNSKSVHYFPAPVNISKSLRLEVMKPEDAGEVGFRAALIGCDSGIPYAQELGLCELVDDLVDTVSEGLKENREFVLSEDPAAVLVSIPTFIKSVFENSTFTPTQEFNVKLEVEEANTEINIVGIKVDTLLDEGFSFMAGVEGIEDEGLVTSGRSTVASDVSTVASDVSTVASGVSTVASGVSTVASGVSTVGSGTPTGDSGISTVTESATKSHISITAGGSEKTAPGGGGLKTVATSTNHDEETEIRSGPATQVFEEGGGGSTPGIDRGTAGGGVTDGPNIPPTPAARTAETTISLTVSREAFSKLLAEGNGTTVIVVLVMIIAQVPLDNTEIPGLANSAPVAHIGSPIIQINTLAGDQWHQLTELNFTLPIKNISEGTKYTSTCAYFDEHTSDESQRVKWMTEGCEKIEEITGKNVTCACNHTTSYAVLLQVGESKHGSSALLSFVSTAGLTVSISALTVALLIYFLFRADLSATRYAIHSNLMIAFLLMAAVFLSGLLNTESDLLCYICKYLLMYLVMACFCWMLAEGVHLYRQIITVFESEQKNWLYFVIGWGLPLVFTIVSIGFTVTSELEPYSKDRRCFFSPKDGSIWVVAAPVYFIILVNLVVLCRVTFIVFNAVRFQKGKDASEKIMQVRASLRSALVLTPLLGSTYIIASVTHVSLALELAYNFFNSLQGFFIALCYCALNSEVRNAINSYIRRSRDQSTIQTVQGSTTGLKAGGGSSESKSFFGRRNKVSPNEQSQITNMTEANSKLHTMSSEDTMPMAS